jgi:hypothetical protein
LESGIDATVATGHNPLVGEEPELARPLAASGRGPHLSRPEVDPDAEPV